MRWRDCVSEALGEPGPDAPVGAEAYLLERWSAILRASGHDPSDGALPISFVALPSAERAALLDRLAVVESTLYAADQSCREQSGMNDLDRQMAALVLSELPDSFFEIDVEPVADDG